MNAVNYVTTPPGVIVVVVVVVVMVLRFFILGIINLRTSLVEQASLPVSDLGHFSKLRAVRDARSTRRKITKKPSGMAPGGLNHCLDTHAQRFTTLCGW
ncbi:hypothetical protein [Dulcicalothrix desertica]|uniref:hypothetical protein n=1 Tax=Dulcicalothrix desertica TaxID=32056 RepID=UPI000F8EF42C|nr:hypothetical protein [Dulcicalothrix desertica]TWH53865.1 hypothetical protein CAL7102_01857 [Dulcicalothrix desertica PCC 7102]